MTTCRQPVRWIQPDASTPNTLIYALAVLPQLDPQPHRTNWAGVCAFSLGSFVAQRDAAASPLTVARLGVD